MGARKRERSSFLFIYTLGQLAISLDMCWRFSSASYLSWAARAGVVAFDNGRVPHGRVSHGRATSWACTSWCLPHGRVPHGVYLPGGYLNGRELPGNRVLNRDFTSRDSQALRPHG